MSESFCYFILPILGCLGCLFGIWIGSKLFGGGMG